jgi:tetratricopeptide (TPR) repeat protein
VKKVTSVLLIGAMVLVVAPGCSRGDRASATVDDAALVKAQTELQLVREDGDPTHYARAEDLLHGLPGDDIGVLVTRGTLALAKHDFAGAHTIADRALELAPESAAALGLAVDASNELGRYDDALDYTQRMVDLHPDLASLSRVSYARELRGDLPGAIGAMTQAIASGAGNRENIAYTQVQLAGLLLTSGDADGADRVLDEAEALLPGFAPVKVARARVLIARERLVDAADILQEVLQVQPTAEAAILRSDALRAAGRDTRGADDLVTAIVKLYRANGVNTDLETALHRADRDPGDDAVTQARNALAERPSTLGHDVLAWNLHMVGDDDAAWTEMRRALALGSRDPQLRFHAASIAFARGDERTAATHLRVVLDGNPRFSPTAIAAVRELASTLGLS